VHQARGNEGAQLFARVGAAQEGLADQDGVDACIS
jgi:hypothetical protein